MAQPVERQLSYLGFQMAAPSHLLQPFVRSYWYFRRELPLAEHHWEFMHPSGGYGLIFNLGDPLHLDEELIRDPVFLDGTNTVSRRMGFYGRVEVLGIRFHEGGAFPFLGIPLSELRNEQLLLSALKEPGLVNLLAHLQETPELPDRIKLLENWLLGRLALGLQRSAIIPHSLKMLQANAEPVAIPALARDLAIGQRQLERLFQVQVGMSPKQYSQLQRVERARLALKRTATTMTALGADMGYYDQSHFIREFRAVIGMTPFAYLRRNRIEADS